LRTELDGSIAVAGMTVIGAKQKLPTCLPGFR